MHSIALLWSTNNLASLLFIAVAFNFQLDNIGYAYAQTVDDRCSGATPIQVDETISSSTIGQTVDDELNFVNCKEGGVFDGTSPGVWFQVIFSAGGTHKLHATTCFEESDSFDQRISVFRANPDDCSNGSCLEDHQTNQNMGSKISSQATTKQQEKIKLLAFASRAGEHW